LFDNAPLVVELQSPRPQIVDIRIVHALGMTARHAYQTSHRLFRHLDQAGCGPHTTAFVEMLEDVDSFGLWELGIA
jgi:hypothetical protein